MILEHITPDLLTALEHEFDLVELVIHNSASVRLKVKMPAHYKRGSTQRQAKAEAYMRILNLAGLGWVDTPAELDGMTGIVISAKLKIASHKDAENTEVIA